MKMAVCHQTGENLTQTRSPVTAIKGCGDSCYFIQLGDLIYEEIL